jgi:signal transduction histidine kinase
MTGEAGASDPADDQRVEAVAKAWQTAMARIAYMPYSADEIRARFRRLASDTLEAMAASEAAEVVARRGRAIAGGLTELNLLKPEALERTLICLSQELAGVAPPQRIASLLAGLAGGFAAAVETTLLAHQESIGRAATVALERARGELEISRDSLTAANRQLSAQIEERVRAEAAQRDYAERLKRLHEIDLAILSAKSLPDIADISIAYIQEQIPALCVWFALFDLETDQSVILRSNNANYPVGRRFAITQMDALQVMREGDPFYLPDLQVIRELSSGMAELADMGGRSLMAMPLYNQGELIGSLVIVLNEVRLFAPAELAIGREITDSIAVAIQNRHLVEAEQEARRSATILREVAASLTQGLNLDEVLRHILEQLDRVIAGRSSAILLLDGGQPVVASQRGAHITPAQADLLLTIKPRSIWDVLETSQPRILNETLGSPDWYTLEGLEYIRSYLAVPLLVKGDCIGVLAIDRDQPNAFNDEDVNLALTFANQAAVAIENARLFRRQQVYAEDLEARVRDRTRELEVLYGITNAAVGQADMDSLLRRSLELSLDAFGCPAGVIHLSEGEARELQLAVCCDRHSPALAELLRRSAADDPGWLEPLLSGAPSIKAAPDLPAEWLAAGVEVCAVAPLRSLNRTMGVITLLCDRPDCFTRASLPLLTTIADQIGAAVENIDLRRLSRQAAIIEERERLAHDLHDAVTQTIYSASLFAEAARESIQARNLPKARRHVLSVLRMTDQALRELRLLLFELRTETLARKGLASALQERFQMVEHRAGIKARVQPSSVKDHLPANLEDTFYRVALEALNNSLRHARATQVEVILTMEGRDIVMTIADDGVGFDQDARNGGGMGLEGMKKRLARVNGAMTLTSSPGGGTRIIVRAPDSGDSTSGGNHVNRRPDSSIGGG